MRASAAALAMALVAATACPRHQPGPPSLTPTVAELTEGWPLGAWAIVTLDSGRTVGGELIAVDHANARLYLGWGERLVWVPTGSVQRVEVAQHRRDSDGHIGWSWAGFLSTITHGYFLVFTGPMWLLGAAGASNHGSQGFERDPADLNAWARFPQGIPVELAARAVPFEGAR